MKLLTAIQQTDKANRQTDRQTRLTNKQTAGKTYPLPSKAGQIYMHAHASIILTMR